MKKHIYKHIGYYNQVGDIRELGGKSADEILNYMKKGYGAFYSSDSESDRCLETDYEETDFELGIIKVTADKKFIIEDGTAYFYDWKKQFADNEDGDDSDTYIDIFELYESYDDDEELDNEEDDRKCYYYAAHEIVCKMIDSKLVESVPEGLMWEKEITQILKNYF